MAFDDTQENYKNFRRIYQQNKVIPFIGAGFSRPAAYTWKDFLEKYYQELVDKNFLEPGDISRYTELNNSSIGNKDELIANHLINCGRESNFRKAIKKYLNKDIRDDMLEKFKLFHQAFSTLKVTTNYDTLIEQGNPSQKDNPIFPYWGNSRDSLNTLLTKRDYGNFLLKIHGDVSVENTIVLSSKHYEQIYGDGERYSPDSTLVKVLERLYRDNTLLFIGCSLDRDRTLMVLEDLNNNGCAQQHYAIVHKDNNTVKFNRSLADKNIDPIWIGSYDEIDEIFEGLINSRIDYDEIAQDYDSYFAEVKRYIDRQNIDDLKVLLNSKRDFYSNTKNTKFRLTYELYSAKCCELEERYEDALEEYNRIEQEYPRDFLASLYLASYYLSVGNHTMFDQQLNKAKKRIPSSHWLYDYLQYSNVQSCGVKVFFSKKMIASENDKQIRSVLYELMCRTHLMNGDMVQALTTIEEAIRLSPDNVSFFLMRLRILVGKLPEKKYVNLVEESLNQFKKRFSDSNSLNTELLIKYCHLYYMYDTNQAFDKSVLEETFYTLLKCSFDIRIEKILCDIFLLFTIPKESLIDVLNYLSTSSIDRGIHISNYLNEYIFFNLSKHNLLTAHGIEYYSKVKATKFIELIKAIDEKNVEKIFAIVDKKEPFAINFVQSLNSTPDLQYTLINQIEIPQVMKQNLLVIHYFKLGELEKAEKELNKIPLDTFNYHDLKSLVFRIYKENESWFELIQVIDTLLNIEVDVYTLFNLRIEKFYALIELKSFKTAFELSGIILESNKENEYCSTEQIQGLLADAIYSCMSWSCTRQYNLDKALEFLRRYKPNSVSYKFQIGIEAKVYVLRGELEEAINVITDAVISKGDLNAYEYAKLYELVSVRISNDLPISNKSKDIIQDGDIVKLSDSPLWYYVGKDCVLDTLDSFVSGKYDKMIGQKLGTQVRFQSKYGKETLATVDCILDIRQYLLHKVIESYNTLGKADNLEDTHFFETPNDPEQMINKWIEHFENIYEVENSIFKEYSEKEFVPLSILSIATKGIEKAFCKIFQSENAFIKGSSGNLQKVATQIAMCREILNTDKPFVIDGTAAFLLSESGCLKKMLDSFNNIIIPESVILFLQRIANSLIPLNNQKGGRLGYNNGKVYYRERDLQADKDLIEKINSDLQYLETCNVEIVSPQPESNFVSHNFVPDEITDAYLLSQKYDCPILTDDYNTYEYRHAEAKEPLASYISTFALVKTLYTSEELSLEDYLSFFNFLTQIRYQYLHFTVEDLKNAVYGTSIIAQFKPEAIRNFNFRLTLSENYGASIKNATHLLAEFLTIIVLDQSISNKLLQMLFIEIINEYPDDLDKYSLCLKLIDLCQKSITYHNGNQVLNANISRIQTLENTSNIFAFSNKYHKIY